MRLLGQPVGRTPFVDFSRHAELLDHELVGNITAACIGTGGAAGLVHMAARAGILKWVLVDPQTLEPANPATQAHDQKDIGKYKVEALARRLRDINAQVDVAAYPKSYQDLTIAELARVWSAGVVLAMTDKFATQAVINRDAIAAGKDTFFASCYIGCGAVEVTATLFPEALTVGCHHCHTKRRYDDYKHGYVNPSVIQSHAIAAEYLNALIALLVISRLHQRAGSALAIADIARDFAQRPCLISRMVPSFGSGHGEAFPDLPPEPFTTRLYELDTPSDWVCPDCGTRGVVSALASQQV